MQALYLKYRPQDFENLKGQEHIRQTLTNALKEDHAAHAYLFTGPRGTGKTSTARLVAKTLNCEDPRDGQCCNECARCKEASSGHQVDIIEIDAASNRGIDEMRALRDSTNTSPVIAKNKIFIIDEVHMLTKEAFNALLKTLEEPPEYVYFILATTEIHKVPTTIISRCQRFDFNRIIESDLVARLEHICQNEEIAAEKAALEEIARLAEGGFRDAISLLDQVAANGKVSLQDVMSKAGLVDRILVEQFAGYITSGDTQNALQDISALYQDGIDLQQFTKQLISFLHASLIQAAYNKDPQKADTLLTAIMSMKEVLVQEKTATIPTLPLEMAVIKIAKEGWEEVKAINEKKQVPEVEPETKEVQQVPQKEPEVPKTPDQKVVPEQVEEVSQPEPVVEKTQNTGPLSIEVIAETWENMVNEIPDVMVKMPYKDAKPAKLESGVLTLQFSSNFNKEKASSLEAITIVKEKMFQKYGASVDLEFVTS